MEVTVEISKYPLSEEYIPKIKDFIDRCNSYDVTIKTNAMSTQIVGEYDLVMNLLKTEIKNSFDKYGKVIFITKFIHGELDI